MKIIIDKNECESFKFFYETAYQQLNGQGYVGWDKYVNFNYNADMLIEFLSNVYKGDNIEFVMDNFVFDCIVNPTTQDDYQWQSIFRVLDSLNVDYSRYELTIVNGVIHITIDKNKCESYKTFYETIYKQLNGKGYIDWEDYDNINYNAGLLYEFLWYAHDIVNTEFVMVNFDLDKIQRQKTYDDYEWNIILKVLNDFVKDYPNNKLKFI